MSKRTSIIWTMPRDDFANLVKQSSSIADILRFFGFVPTGGTHRMVKERCKEDSIDLSHISLGVGSNKGRHFQHEMIPLDQVMVEHSTYHRGNLKRRLMQNGIIKNVCSVCGQEPIWNGQKLTMVLDHINGVRDDNRLLNLRLLCPNCNSQTDTFAGRMSKKHHLCQCGAEKWRTSHKCAKCNGFDHRRVERPDINVLQREVEQFGYLATGRHYGVSDNTVRKWFNS